MTADSKTTALSAAIRALAESDVGDPVLIAGIEASVRTLNLGVYQWTRKCYNAEVVKKHQARLVAALHAIADALEQEEMATF